MDQSKIVDINAPREYVWGNCSCSRVSSREPGRTNPNFIRREHSRSCGAGVIRAPFPPLRGATVARCSTRRCLEVIASASPSTALLAAMPWAGWLYSAGPDAAPPQHRSRGRAIDRVAADFERGLYAACNSEKGAGGSLARQNDRDRREEVFELTGEKILASFGKHADMFFRLPRSALPRCPAAYRRVLFRASESQRRDDPERLGWLRMRSTESQTVRYDAAVARASLDSRISSTFPAAHVLVYVVRCRPPRVRFRDRRELSTPAPETPALRVSACRARMRGKGCARICVRQRACAPSAGPAYAARVLRTRHTSRRKQPGSAELFALSGAAITNGRGARAHPRRIVRWTALRPPCLLRRYVVATVVHR